MTRYRWFLLAAFLLVWAWAAVLPRHRHDWLLENVLVFVFVPVLVLLARYFRLSDVSYTLIALFLVLHLVGSHYTYAEVPFGFTLQRWLGSTRNMYDRLVHFSFGFFLAYPMREVFWRVARARGFWGYYLPFDVVMSLSAVFELFEWGIVALVNPEAGSAYLGTQGDEWDAQKDMLSAGVGALLAMLVIAGINWRYRRREFTRELRDSFRLEPGDRPLGEVALREMARD